MICIADLLPLVNSQPQACSHSVTRGGNASLSLRGNVNLAMLSRGATVLLLLLFRLSPAESTGS
jgi:hypothetical protein